MTKLRYVVFTVLLLGCDDSPRSNDNELETNYDIVGGLIMDAKWISEQYIKHNILTKTDASTEEFKEFIQELEDDDMNSEEIAFEILSEYAPDQSFFYSLADGGWSGELINEFYANIETIIEMSNGSIEIKDLVLTPPLDKNGNENVHEKMSISFSHNGKQYEWSFSASNNDDFIEGFTKWAFSALEGNFLYQGDGPVGHFLPKELIAELKKIGIHNEMDTWD